MADSLKNKTLRGVSWSFADNIANQGITFFIGLILARLLTPDEFGIIGMIAIFIAISNSIVDSGFSNALIRKIDVKVVDYNTVFYFNIVISIILYGILYLIAPTISHFFKEPILIPVTRVFGVVLIFNGMAVIQRTLLFKAVDFKTQTKISLISSISSGVIGISMALLEYGVWSLVWQQISRQFINTLFLWIFSKWKPVWEYSYQSFKELFGFGSKLLISGLIDTVYQNIYYLIIGRFYSAAQLGQYTRAAQFKEIFASNLTTVIQKVSFPVLSSIQEEPERLKVAYRKIIKSTMLITFACMLGLIATAKPLIVILIGEKWLEAVGYLQIIGFAGMLYPLHAINLNVLKVKGRSDLFLKLEIIKKILAVIPISLGIFLGIKIMLWGSVLNSIIAYFLNSHYSGKLISYPTRSQILDIMPTFITSGIVAICMWIISFLPISYFIMLPLQCTLGIVMAWIIYEKSKLPEYQEIKEIMVSFILKRK